MTVTLTRSNALPEAGTLGPALNAAHDVWIREASSYLLPLMADGAGFWERWTAARYVADQFLAQFQRERALVGELRPLLPLEVAGRLERGAERIAQQREHLDRIGRRRGTAPAVAVAARALLHAVRIWCTEIEIAAGGLLREQLPPEAGHLVDDLELYAGVHA